METEDLTRKIGQPTIRSVNDLGWPKTLALNLGQFRICIMMIVKCPGGILVKAEKKCGRLWIPTRELGDLN